MPRRWSEMDTDLERLPEGMVRIAYDSDTQIYTYRDSDGSVWEGAPGCEYGLMRRVSFGYGSASSSADAAAPFLSASETESQLRRKEQQQTTKDEMSWRVEMMPILNFFLLVAAAMLLLMYFISRPSHADTSSREAGIIEAEMHEMATCVEGNNPYKIVAGDTCWDIAQAHGIELANLAGINEGVACDALEIGQTICVPSP